MANSYSISSFGSLNFDHNWKIDPQTPRSYMQKFEVGDRIRVQYSAFGSLSSIVKLTNIDTEEGISVDREAVYVDDSGMTTYEVLMDSLAPGTYQLEITLTVPTDYTIASTRFCVFEKGYIKEVLGHETVLMSYTHYRDYFENIFSEDRIFDFRFEGAINPIESQLPVDAEGFRDQQYNYNQLSAFPYRKDVLTIGEGVGVPVWVAEKVNNILSLSYVVINKHISVRSEESFPEATTTSPGYPLSWYKVEIERDKNEIDEYDPVVLWVLEDGTWNNDNYWLDDGIWQTVPRPDISFQMAFSENVQYDGYEDVQVTIEPYGDTSIDPSWSGRQTYSISEIRAGLSQPVKMVRPGDVKPQVRTYCSGGKYAEMKLSIIPDTFSVIEGGVNSPRLTVELNDPEIISARLNVGGGNPPPLNYVDFEVYFAESFFDTDHDSGTLTINPYGQSEVSPDFTGRRSYRIEEIRSGTSVPVKFRVQEIYNPQFEVLYTGAASGSVGLSIFPPLYNIIDGSSESTRIVVEFTDGLESGAQAAARPKN